MQRFDEFSSLGVVQAGKDENLGSPVVSRAGQGFTAFLSHRPDGPSGDYGSGARMFLQATVVGSAFK